MIWRGTNRLDDGFSLIELLIVIAILPVIVGAISLGFVTSLSNKNTTVTRLSDSHDAQITSEYFVRDVKSAQYVSTSNTSMCGSTSYLLGLSWSVTNSSGNVVTDNVIYKSDPSSGTLMRTFCNSSSSTTTLSHSAFPTSPAVTLSSCPNDALGNGATSCYASGGTTYAAVTVNCTDGSTTCANSGSIAATPQTKTAVGVNSIKFSALSYDSTLAVNQTTPFSYTVTSSPQGWVATTTGGGQAPTPPLDLIGPNATATLGGSSSCSLTVNGVAAVNNTSNGSVSLGNNNSFSATDVYSQSNNPVSGGNGPSPTVIVGPPLADPFANMTPPSAGDPNVTVNNSGSLSGQLDGIYILNNGLSLSGNTNLTAKPISSGGHGVLLYVPPSSPTGIDLTGNGTITLDQIYSNPPSQNFNGVVIWVANGKNVSLGGNGNTTTIGGLVYDPKGSVTLNGGGGSGGVNAAGIVAKSLSCSGGGNGVGFTTGPLNTKTVVSATPTTGTDQQSETLTAKVTYTDPTTGTQQPVTSGSVIFQVVGNNGVTTTDCAAAAPLDGTGTATCTTAPLSASLSKYQINATYQGTSAFGPSSANPVPLTVLEPTTTTVTTTASNLVSGQTATFTATVAGNDGSKPTGSVTFAGVTCTGGNTKTLPGAAPDQVTCTSGTLLAGNAPYNVTATYTESATPATWQTSTGSLSVPVAIAPTTTTVVSNHPSSRPSQQVIFTATVSPTPDGGTITWTIAGNTGPSSNCTGTGYTKSALTAGIATCTVAGGTLTNGNAPYSVTAVYSGDANYATSTGTLTPPQNIAQVATQVVFVNVSHPTTGNAANKRKYTDNVTVTAADGSVPTGTVAFYLCTNATTGCNSVSGTHLTPDGTVNATTGAAASAQTASLTSGTNYCFAAVYSGTTDYLSSSDTTVDQCFKVP